MITNEEFENLMKMSKHFIENNLALPTAGEKSSPFLVASDTTRDCFALDIDRKSGITLTKIKLQERHTTSAIMMIRVEIDCRPHMFPDGSKSSRNHIHIFDEKCGNSVYDLSTFKSFFTNIADFETTFYDFCNLCNISTNNINIQGVMI